MIRMKPEEAMRAGLIDPMLAADLSARQQPPSKKRRKRKKAPAPAPKLVPEHEIPGSGRLEVDETGNIQIADFEFLVMPVPKERARVVQDAKTGANRSYTPQRTEAFHREIHRVLKDVLGSHQAMSGPIALDITFRMPVPPSWPLWRQEAALEGLIRPTGRPDIDNIEKALLDAFNGELIEDDSLIVEKNSREIYATMPGIEATATRLLAGDIHIKREQVEKLRRIAGLCKG